MRALTAEENAAPAESALARRLGNYELRAKIADGGMAEVHVARRVGGPGAGEVVAIKTIRDQFARNREFVTMFMDEAKIVSRLRHPNVIRYHELGSEDEQLFLAMELLFGQSLWSLWDACRTRNVRLRYDMIAWIGARVADGLHYAHELVDEAGAPLDIVHRDVNATNIFVTYDGEIKVIDFGLAKAANRASKTAAGVIKGKVAYMSPEQAVGAPVDRRTDVFALGTTVWELSCDRRLFKRPDDVETLRRVHAAEVPDPTRLVEGFPPELWRILQGALARHQDRRYRTAADLARDLDAFAARESKGKCGPRSVAKVMRELFADDRSRQIAWVTEVSGPASSAASGRPLKARSTFWTGDEAPVAPPVRMPLSTPPAAFHPSRPAPGSLAHEASRRRGRMFAVATAVAIAVVSVVVALAYR
ncbi:MAG TPA: serine/threonine-protein kinase [Polyangiaceae bacterium]|jgi:serine/threonine-protein kinase|nr:serine/threonine-protein kinase [Polyangiaceae bacterium]